MKEYKEFAFYYMIREVELLFRNLNNFYEKPRTWKIKMFFNEIQDCQRSIIHYKSFFQGLDDEMVKEMESFWKLIISIKEEMEDTIQRKRFDY